jgi:hypothetical protein
MLARKCVRDASGEGREGGVGETLRDAELLGRAIERAVERARVDARLAVPAYDGGTGTVYLLLPLCGQNLRAELAGGGIDLHPVKPQLPSQTQAVVQRQLEAVRNDT